MSGYKLSLQRNEPRRGSIIVENVGSLQQRRNYQSISKVNRCFRRHDPTDDFQKDVITLRSYVLNSCF